MIFVLAVMAQALHVALMLAAAPILAGVVGWVQARLLGRRGPGVLQPWRDIRRLFRKQPVLAENASWLFRAAPGASLVAMVMAAALIPSFVLGMAFSPLADLLLIVGLLAAARGIGVLAGMDVGTAFGGIGASREVMVAAFAEPAMMLVIVTLALLAGGTNLDAIVTLFHATGVGLRVSLGLILVAMLAIAIAENGVLPAGSPGSHLELTMGHHALLLEYSGRHLGLLAWAEALKLLVWLSLIAAIFAPWGIAEIGVSPVFWVVGAGAWVAKIGGLAAGLALLQVSIAKMRVFRVPEFLGVALLLGLLAAVFLFVSQGFA